MHEIGKETKSLPSSFWTGGGAGSSRLSAWRERTGCAS